MPNIRLTGAAVKPVKGHENTDRHTDCNFIYILEICSLLSQIYSKATAPGSLIKNFLTESFLALVLPALETPEGTWQSNFFDQK